MPSSKRVIMIAFVARRASPIPAGSHILALAFALLLPAASHAFDASRHGSPTYNTTNTNRLLIQGRSSTGEISGMSARPVEAAEPRTFADWFSDRANVAAFPGADLSAKFAAACASLRSSGGAIYIPGRTWTANGALVCQGKAVSVLGDGPGVTTVNFTSAAAGAAGIILEPGDALRPLTVRDVSLVTLVDQVNGNNGISITYGSAFSNIFKGPKIQNVEIVGAGNNTTYWGNGVRGRNIWGFDIHQVHVRGKDVGGATVFPAANTNAAVLIEGQNGGGCSDGKISGVNAIFVRYVGYVSGLCEGLHWIDNTGVAVGNGIVWPDAKAYPGFFIARNHFNAFTKGIAVSGAVQGIVSDNLIYKWTNSAQNFAGLSFLTYTSGGTTYFANNNIAHHNTIVGYAGAASQGGESIGIDATGGDGNIFQGNTFLSTDYAFDFGNISTKNTAADNTAVGTVSGWQKRVGFSTVSRNNTPALTGNDQWNIPLTGGGTPNVGAWFQRFFVFGDTAARTYTDFTNAEAGHQITLIGVNANSTVANNARVRLRGGANFTTSVGSALTLIFTGEYWQEVGRSQ